MHTCKRCDDFSGNFEQYGGATLHRITYSNTRGEEYLDAAFPKLSIIESAKVMP